jgi:CheY-like chemotaxis protein
VEYGLTVEQVLIVDDSKTAQLILRNRLQKLNIDVAMVESGEEALIYLKDHQPGVIFMDHMMPGMDGFEAVKAIKSDPSLAAIPIVMHTSKNDSMYIGQAKALGAADIYTKPGNDSELLRVMERLQTLAEANITPPGSAAIEVDSSAAIEESFTIATSPAAPTTGAEPRHTGLHTSTLDGTGAALTQRFAEIAHSVSDTGFFGSLRQRIVALIWLVSSLWLFFLYISAQVELDRQAQQRSELYQALQWSLNQQRSYDFGEVALGGARLELLRSLLPQLARAGFAGTLRFEGHVGDFCLSQIRLDDGAAIEMLPAFDSALTQCSTIGVGRNRALADSVAQTTAFSNYLEEARLRYPKIAIDTAAFGATRPARRYPEILQAVTVGQWNEVALANNRINLRLLPAPYSVVSQ